mmetsp:Transcript_19436/g.46953  ORF Transcript_19436/g.46953 Transcript_19436/m.46953 type:complete len:235 (-) Transcript_19436:104-808(-)
MTLQKSRMKTILHKNWIEMKLKVSTVKRSCHHLSTARPSNSMKHMHQRMNFRVAILMSRLKGPTTNPTWVSLQPLDSSMYSLRATMMRQKTRCQSFLMITAHILKKPTTAVLLITYRPPRNEVIRKSGRTKWPRRALATVLLHPTRNCRKLLWMYHHHERSFLRLVQRKLGRHSSRRTQVLMVLAKTTNQKMSTALRYVLSSFHHRRRSKKTAKWSRAPQVTLLWRLLLSRLRY